VGNRDGTVALTFNPIDLGDSNALQADLAEFGVPALVTTGQFCTSDPAPADLSQVMSYQATKHPTMTIHPTPIPRGAALSSGIFQLEGGDVRASTAALIDRNAYTCTSTFPNDVGQQSGRQGYFILGPSH